MAISYIDVREEPSWSSSKKRDSVTGCLEFLCDTSSTATIARDDFRSSFTVTTMAAAHFLAVFYLLAQCLDHNHNLQTARRKISRMPKKKIILLGDSLTQLSFEGWGATLANVYQRRADVLNRGYSGYNTRFYLQLPPLLEEEEEEKHNTVVLAVIFFGANDAALLEQDAHHHVPLDEYQLNLATLVEQTRRWTKNILLIAPPPVHHEQRLAYQKLRFGDKATGVLERTLEQTGRYAKACVEVAASLQLPCLDLYTSMLQQEDWASFLNDGLHFSAKGHEFVGTQLLQTIQEQFPDLHVQADATTGQWCNSGSKCKALSSHGPYHDQIDSKNVSAAFADI